jgi:signal transduction histidine kinase
MTDDLVKRLHSFDCITMDGCGRKLRHEAADRIEELEDKLNKAIDALEKVQAFVRDLEPHADHGHTLVPALREACETLAELKGETDD